MNLPGSSLFRFPLTKKQILELETPSIASPTPLSPLSPSTRLDWAEVVQVAARLRSEISSLIASLPEHARGASGMSRHTGILRSTCQRVVGAAQDTSPHMISRLPGVEGLRLFIKGVAKAGAAPQDVAAAINAVEALERLIVKAGGSHAKLVEQISGHRPPGEGTALEGSDELASLQQRQDLFRVASSICGRRCRTALSIYAFRVVPGAGPGGGAILERTMGKGVIGASAVPGGMPFLLNSGNTASESGGPTTLDRGVPSARTRPKPSLSRSPRIRSRKSRRAAPGATSIRSSTRGA